ncbi:Radical_SAM domain containing protein [uncultured Caudovirales phage]|uniref:Radical_SAM domain containing protein n=1 Tax=uncultured Caudovirales phage TaxID=2100421 RepID=A0A6J5T0N0_9CAUD|nr:Radical_SAM domain containing protein [uncultured Caudovirales phage]CAB4165615.1 Radical_SAM domain containing protein [uncultured Caudovirales phage]CAB4186734.1 Radical_SAM domain containing protein [uncultured Caudovirales phage]CAB4220806.1 Radical_SAM domain containing protein [uncultured Caudovirales phage]
MRDPADSYCPLYNQGLYIEKVNSEEANISMCCYQAPSTKLYKQIDFISNEYLSNIRQSYAAGTAPAECDQCWNLEKLKYQSYRQGELLSQKIDQRTTYATPTLTNLLYNCENVCNLKCIICGPRYSSLWRDEYKKLGYPLLSITESKKQTKHNNLFVNLDFSKLEAIHFQGGEPFLTSDHKKILQKAKEDGSISKLTVSYNTNGTVLPDEETINLWKLAKLVKVYFSIDSIGESFNYVRFPADWKQVEHNIINGFFKITDPNIIFSIGPTVNITNVFYIGDIISWLYKNIPCNLQGDQTEIYINPVGNVSYGGQVLNLKNLSKELQQKAIAYLEQFKEHKVILPIINSLSTISETPNNWVEYLEKLDQLRLTNWRNSLQQLSQHIV